MAAGSSQQVFYAEFDGQRRKRVIIKVMGERAAAGRQWTALNNSALPPALCRNTSYATLTWRYSGVE
jgi:hypothetical protein